MNLISCISAEAAPPPAASTVTILTFEYPPTSATVEKFLHPLVAVVSVTNPANVIIFPFDTSFPNIPSPNCTSYFPSSISSIKYCLEVELTVVISFAKSYAKDADSVLEVCTVTVKVSVSIFAFGRRYLWSTSAVSAVYLYEIGIP